MWIRASSSNPIADGFPEQVAGGVWIPFTPETLAAEFTEASQMPQVERERWGTLARARVD